MTGSVRQRGAASWELRVYAGMNPDTGKRRYRTATVVGYRADAERALARLVAEVQFEKTIGSASTVSDFLEAWFAIASTSWAPTTVRETRSILDRCVHPVWDNPAERAHRIVVPQTEMRPPTRTSCSVSEPRGNVSMRPDSAAHHPRAHFRFADVGYWPYSGRTRFEGMR